MGSSFFAVFCFRNAPVSLPGQNRFFVQQLPFTPSTMLYVLATVRIIRPKEAAKVRPRRYLMNRRSFAIGTLLLFAVPASPQQPAAEVAAVTDVDGIPTVQSQMKLFSARLDLNEDQQARVQTILQDLHDATAKSVHDESVSSAERTASIHAERMRADKRIRDVLTDEQRKKLDQVEQEPHPELHGNIR
jgi:Spy/CpxP family protein refolding chaperone